MRINILVFTAAAVVAGARPASAQGTDLGGNLSVIGFTWGDVSPVMAGPIVTFPLL